MEDQKIMAILQRKSHEKRQLSSTSVKKDTEDPEIVEKKPSLSDHWFEYHTEKQKNEIMKEQIEVLMKQNQALISCGHTLLHSFREFKEICDQTDAQALAIAFDEPASSSLPEPEWRREDKYIEIIEKDEKGKVLEGEMATFMQKIHDLDQTNQAIKQTVNEVFQLDVGPFSVPDSTTFMKP